MRSKYVINGGTKLHYVVREGSKPAIVLLHGAGSNHTVWTQTIPYLKGRRLILPDFRGHGKSARGSISLSESTSDLRSILKNEKEDVVDLVGYSLGATIAAEFAGQDPKHVNKLVLMSIVSNNLTRLSGVAGALNLALLKLIKLFKPGRKLTFQDYGGNKNIISSLMSDVKGTSMTAYVGAADMVIRNDIDISKIKHKTLLLQGRHDYSIYKSLLRKRINDKTELKFLPTHHLLVNKPEDLGPELKNFLIS